jgi:hypothetical protein
MDIMRGLSYFLTEISEQRKRIHESLQKIYERLKQNQEKRRVYRQLLQLRKSIQEEFEPFKDEATHDYYLVSDSGVIDKFVGTYLHGAVRKTGKNKKGAKQYAGMLAKIRTGILGIKTEIEQERSAAVFTEDFKESSICSAFAGQKIVSESPGEVEKSTEKYADELKKYGNKLEKNASFLVFRGSDELNSRIEKECQALTGLWDTCVQSLEGALKAYNEFDTHRESHIQKEKKKQEEMKNALKEVTAKALKNLENAELQKALCALQAALDAIKGKNAYISDLQQFLKAICEEKSSKSLDLEEIFNQLCPDVKEQPIAMKEKSIENKVGGAAHIEKVIKILDLFQLKMTESQSVEELDRSKLDQCLSNFKQQLKLVQEKVCLLEPEIEDNIKKYESMLSTIKKPEERMLRKQEAVKAFLASVSASTESSILRAPRVAWVRGIEESKRKESMMMTPIDKIICAIDCFSKDFKTKQPEIQRQLSNYANKFKYLKQSGSPIQEELLRKQLLEHRNEIYKHIVRLLIDRHSRIKSVRKFNFNEKNKRIIIVCENFIHTFKEIPKSGLHSWEKMNRTFKIIYGLSEFIVKNMPSNLLSTCKEFLSRITSFKDYFNDYLRKNKSPKINMEFLKDFDVTIPAALSGIIDACGIRKRENKFPDLVALINLMAQLLTQECETLLTCKEKSFMEKRDILIRLLADQIHHFSKRINDEYDIAGPMMSQESAMLISLIKIAENYDRACESMNEAASLKKQKPTSVKLTQSVVTQDEKGILSVSKSESQAPKEIDAIKKWVSALTMISAPTPPPPTLSHSSTATTTTISTASS